jgi:spore coat protein U-like protein
MLAFEEMDIEMQNLKFKKFVIAAAAAFVATTACAQDATVGVSATITAECAVAGSTLVFPKLTMLDTVTANQSNVADVQTNNIRAICTNGTPTVNFIYTSENTTGTDFQLRGADGTTLIMYSLHQDPSAAGGNEVISGGPGAVHPAFAADGVAKDLPISAKVLPSEKAGKTVQTYSDTITVTTSFDA